MIESLFLLPEEFPKTIPEEFTDKRKLLHNLAVSVRPLQEPRGAAGSDEGARAGGTDRQLQLSPQSRGGRGQRVREETADVRGSGQETGERYAEGFNSGGS